MHLKLQDRVAVRRIRAILDKCEFAKQAVSMIELVDEDLVDLCDSSVLQLDEVAHNKDILAFGHTVEKRNLLALFDCQRYQTA